MFAPLEGVRVVDLTHVLAGPYCTQLLAMLGAEVTKIEPPDSGDLTRFGGAIPELNTKRLGLAFCTQNTDKASMTINLKSEEGIDIVRRLVAEADVFVENFRPGVSERLGLGYDALVAVNPNLVYVSLTAYGQDGPIGHRPAYDHVVQAMSGVMEVTGTEESGPVKVGAPIVDYAAGQKGAFATLAAIVEQRRTGQPQRVDSAMLDTTLLLMANTFTATANTGDRPPEAREPSGQRIRIIGLFRDCGRAPGHRRQQRAPVHRSVPGDRPARARRRRPVRWPRKPAAEHRGIPGHPRADSAHQVGR